MSSLAPRTLTLPCAAPFRSRRASLGPLPVTPLPLLQLLAQTCVLLSQCRVLTQRFRQLPLQIRDAVLQGHAALSASIRSPWKAKNTPPKPWNHPHAPWSTWTYHDQPHPHENPPALLPPGPGREVTPPRAPVTSLCRSFPAAYLSSGLEARTGPPERRNACRAS